MGSWPDDATSIFQGFRSEAGKTNSQKNLFIEGVLPSAIIRDLSEKEMTVYRKPFLNELERRPTLDWPRQIPINGEPEKFAQLLKNILDGCQKMKYQNYL